jgi:hypothetical protein
MKEQAKGFFSVVGLALTGLLVISKPVFKLTNLIINPTTIYPGDTVNISVTITNTGWRAGTKRVTLQVITSTAQKDITLKPGKSGVLNFTATPSTAGRYEVAVDGLSGSFNVINEDQMPNPVNGTLYPISGPIGEYEDVSAFLYFNDHDIACAHIESSEGSLDLPIPNNPVGEIWNMYPKTVLTDRHTLWIAYGIPVKVSRYTIGQNGLTLISTDQFGDIDSRLRGFIRLDSGKLIVTWTQQKDYGHGCLVGYAYTDGAGIWHRPGYITMGGHFASMACMCQHPDGSIWFFQTQDGLAGVCAVRFIESGEVISPDLVNQSFIRYDNPADVELRAYGELPWITCAPDPSSNALLIAYQNVDDHVFSYEPYFSKGANITVVKVYGDGTKELDFKYQKWVERQQVFLLGVDSANNPWLAYAVIDEATYMANDLYLMEQPLGKVRGGEPSGYGNAEISLCYSKKYVIASMSDGYIRFFRII